MYSFGSAIIIVIKVHNQVEVEMHKHGKGLLHENSDGELQWLFLATVDMAHNLLRRGMLILVFLLNMTIRFYMTTLNTDIWYRHN